jgi:hypothetical protein
MRLPKGLRLLLLLPAAIAGPAGAQAPPPWAYYPLGVGDVWEYVEPATGSTLRIHVDRDTVINGRVYVVQERVRFDAMGNPIPYVPPFYRLRFDTLSTHVVEPFTDGSGTEVPSRPAPCPFGATGGQTVDCGPFGGAATVRQFMGGLAIGDTALAAVEFKEYETNAALVTYAAAIGEVELSAKFEPYRYLTYARVGEIEYGTPIHPVAAEPSPVRSAEIGVRPNPAWGSDHVNVALRLPASANVQAAAYDALGRRVALLHAGPLQAGLHDLTLDGARLAPGVYVVRVVIDSERTFTQRVTVVR